MTGLRERQRADLRAHVDRVALTLFAERGFDAVPVDEIAAAAGISLSTLFRHVRSKDQLLVGTLRVGRAAIVENFAERPADEPVPAALAAAILRRTEQFADETETIALWRRAMASAPARVRRASLLDDDERARLVVLVAERLGLDAEADLEPGLRVRVALAAAEHAYEHWLTRETGRTLHELTAEALDGVSRG
ncbi:TetR family transcriptional regulator [Nocardioides lianchengensis]|uniref:Regulatory protein, tetR family n=1 Tax=Nocardioides lianchengensis TaxID=1045774 RepID=A0A1G6PM45_9ACTN|nr:TetR family transcriptional regulator [Nocardioides lianchengensis]NYG11898.1 AcrR family transcriptional regulator [Nocardioides lianchengensis]SDC81031.1 regulatory protein, tetR family [Nocardioides lianchengensis]